MDGKLIRIAVEELEALISKKSREIKEHRAGINALLSLCNHNWSERAYDPRGSGTSYYVCLKCGMEKIE